MAWKPKKKHKPLSYAEQQFVKKLIEDAKAKRKTMRGYAIIKKTGSKTDVKISGVFKDLDELKQCTNEFVQMLNERSNNKWTVLEITQSGYEAYADDDEAKNQ